MKQDKKEIVSGAIVEMPMSFLKPLNYSIDLLVKPHPTLRAYTNLKQHSEVDPEFHLFPYERKRIEPKDEISLRNNPQFSSNFQKSLLILLYNSTPSGPKSQKPENPP